MAARPGRFLSALLRYLWSLPKDFRIAHHASVRPPDVSRHLRLVKIPQGRGQFAPKRAQLASCAVAPRLCRSSRARDDHADRIEVEDPPQSHLCQCHPFRRHRLQSVGQFDSLFERQAGERLTDIESLPLPVVTAVVRRSEFRFLREFSGEQPACQREAHNQRDPL